MPGRVFFIWDYDTALGQVNATYPYNFREEGLIEEIHNVDFILQISQAQEIKMTFACVGFAAEPGHWPYHVPEQLQRISQEGHEVASHSWRHEWLPYLEKEQLIRSLRRSKLALETCIGKKDSVVGFVPPFSRPMSWKARFAFSLGDRTWGPRFPGSDLGSLMTFLRGEGYRWCRTTYVPLWRRLSGAGVPRTMTKANQVIGIPLNYCGFDEPALRLLAETVQSGGSLFVSGHPAALSRKGSESREHFVAFAERVSEYQQQGRLQTCCVNTLASVV